MSRTRFDHRETTRSQSVWDNAAAWLQIIPPSTVLDESEGHNGETVSDVCILVLTVHCRVRRGRNV